MSSQADGYEHEGVPDSWFLVAANAW